MLTRPNTHSLATLEPTRAHSNQSNDRTRQPHPHALPTTARNDHATPTARNPHRTVTIPTAQSRRPPHRHDDQRTDNSLRPPHRHDDHRTVNHRHDDHRTITGTTTTAQSQAQRPPPFKGQNKLDIEYQCSKHASQTCPLCICLFIVARFLIKLENVEKSKNRSRDSTHCTQLSLHCTQLTT